MKRTLGLLVVAVVAALTLTQPTAARADGDGDHDRARDLYERGEIHSLSDVLRVIGKDAPGDVVDISLIQLGDKWVYRFQIVASDGHRVTVDVDASAGIVIGDGSGD